MFSHIDNVKLPEDALPVMSSVGKVFPRGDLMEPACRKHLFCLFPPPPLLFFFFYSVFLLLLFSLHLSLSLCVSRFLTFAYTIGLVFLLTDHTI